MSAARIAALEARLADVEERHAEAIARLSMAFEAVVSSSFMGAQEIEDDVRTQLLAVDELVSEHTGRVFDEWERLKDEENEQELTRMVRVVQSNKGNEAERVRGGAERTRDRMKKAANAEEAGA